jgi:hypothetical protein
MALGRGASAIVEQQLASHLKSIERELGADVLTYVGPILHGSDDRIKDAVEELRRRKNRLVFILETNGGFAEVTRRISDALRHHYQSVDFLIPSHAMSAGTILAMSGDSIWMNYYSVLGPIDPQVPSQDGRRLIPALGSLIRYEELLAKANAGNAGAGDLEMDTRDFAAGRKITCPALILWGATGSVGRHQRPAEVRGGPGCLNRFSASISGVSAEFRLPRGAAAG